MRVWILLRFVVLAFLLLNLWYRFSTIFDYSRFVGGLFVALAAISLLVILFPRLLRVFLFLFGASFFLFGFRGFDIQSQVFETIVVFVAITLFLVNSRRNAQSAWRRAHGAPQLNPIQGAPDGAIQRGREGMAQSAERGGGVNPSEMRSAVVNEFHGVNRQLVGLILCYIGLSVLSLQLLPVGHIVKDFWLFGLKSSFLQVANATPNTCLYPLAGINRLILYFVFALEVSRGKEARELFKWIFVGIFLGGVFCAFVGLLDYYGVISLRWYRLGTTTTPGTLHSTFLNRSWLAEFILMMTPFVLIGFMSKIKGLWWKVLLLGSLVVCEIALILAGARGGWVSYPLILFICWLFFYFSKEGSLESFHFGWKSAIKIAVSVPITIIISFLLIFYVFMPLSDYLRTQEGFKALSSSSKSTSKYIKSQTARIVEPSGRVRAWNQGVDVGRERPLFGMGYESFCWHANILSGIPKSYYTVNKDNKHKRVLDTPHNIFFQIFVSGGVAGVGLWALIIGYGLMILVVDLVKNKRLLNVPVIVSIISFHIYGIFQSMQYIPMIWMFIFLNLGYAMTIDEKVLPEKLRRLMGVVVKVMIFLVLIGGVVYFAGRGSQGLAEKYGLMVYAQEQDWHEYHGFYHKEKWGERYYRWSGRRASVVMRRAQSAPRGAERAERRAQSGEERTGMIRMGGQRTEDRGQRTEIRGQGSVVSGQKSKVGRPSEIRFPETSSISRGKVVEFDLQCHTPGVEEETVRVVVYLDGERIDKIWFEKKGGVKRQYYIGAGSMGQGAGRGRPQLNTPKGSPVQRGKHEFLFDVSRTWNPKRMGISADVRDLGVAVREPRLLKEMPKDGVGFYGWETVDAQSAQGMAQSEKKGGETKRFRWTGKSASVPIRMAQSGERGAERAERRAQSGKERTGMIRMGGGLDELVMFLRCSHPDVGDEPVVVRIWGDGPSEIRSARHGHEFHGVKLLRAVIFEKNEWRKVVLGGDEVRDSEVVTFEVSRTWNPKLMGVSEDGRDLGVAVAGP